MKKIELNAALKLVLIILTWLLTITVVNIQSATLSNGGSGLIGTLLIYVGLIYLAFGYFKDKDLQANVKYALIVFVSITAVYLLIQCYDYVLTFFDNPTPEAIKFGDSIQNIFLIVKNVVVAFFLIFSMVTSFDTSVKTENQVNNDEENDKIE